jgi:Tfp pilus assembly protein PilF
MKNGVGACLDRGAVYMEKGDLDRAIEEINKGIDIDPNEAGAYKIRGAVYFKKGDLARGVADLHKTLELDPNQQIIKGIIDMYEQSKNTGMNSQILQLIKDIF